MNKILQLLEKKIFDEELGFNEVPGGGIVCSSCYKSWNHKGEQHEGDCWIVTLRKLVAEELENPTFIIASINREWLETRGYDLSELSDYSLHDLADRISENEILWSVIDASIEEWGFFKI